MVLITSLGNQILTGGKLIRCTVDRNITCLQEEERRGVLLTSYKKEKKREEKGKSKRRKE